MFSLNDSSRYYLYAAYVGCGQIEGLYRLVSSVGGFNPLSGDCFIFVGKSRTTMKVLRWEHDGFILIHKRLEQGTFELPRFKPREGFMQLSYEAFFLIIRGIPLRGLTHHKRLHL